MQKQDETCKCENMVVRCMDYRFHAELPALLAEHFGEECFAYDSPGGCGGSKALIDERPREIILEALDLGVSLHGVRRFIIVDHVDCGAYGGSERFSDTEAERQFHIERLCEAREIVAEAQPDVEVVLFYQDTEGISPIE
jgi:carbonic anhydrase